MCSSWVSLCVCGVVCSVFVRCVCVCEGVDAWVLQDEASKV